MYHTKVNHRVFNADTPTSCQIYGKSAEIWGKTSWMSKNNSKVYYMSCARRRSMWWKRTEPFRNFDSRRFGIAVPGVMHIDTLIVWKKKGPTMITRWFQDPSNYLVLYRGWFWKTSGRCFQCAHLNVCVAMRFKKRGLIFESYRVVKTFNLWKFDG